MNNISAAYDYGREQLKLCGDGSPTAVRHEDGHTFQTMTLLLAACGDWPARPDQGCFFCETYDLWNAQLDNQRGDTLT